MVKNADSVTFGSGKGFTCGPHYIKIGPSNQWNPDSEQKVAIFHDTLRIITADLRGFQTDGWTQVLIG